MRRVIASVVLSITCAFLAPVHAQPTRPPAAPAPLAQPAPVVQQAPLVAPLPLFEAGKKTEALAAAQEMLKSKPNDITALYVAIRVNQEQGKVDDAIRYVQMMVRHHPGLAVTWELATQLYQAAGDKDRRDMALRQLIDTQASAIDRELRARRFILRDRIDAHGRVLLVQEHFDTHGPDAVRYVFIPESATGQPKTFLVVLTDPQTTANWREVGIIGSGKRVFHLDSIYETPDGRQTQAMYAAYADLPDYDTIRAKVLEVMSGTVKPMSGEHGGLAIPAKPAAAAQ